MADTRIPLAPALWSLALAALSLAQHALAINGYDQLVGGIKAANAKAVAACNGQSGCQAPAVTVVLKQNVILTGFLPTLNYSAHLIVQGRCGNKRNHFRCVVDGQNKFPVFGYLSVGPTPPILELDNLIFQKANGGVLGNTWAVVIGTNLIFRNNYMVIVAQGMGGGPTQSYRKCRWVENNGTAINFGGGKYGLSYNGTGLIVKDSIFVRNRVSGTFGGGAVYLSGAGTSIFENVKFVGNDADQYGGAVYASQTTVKFRGVSFGGNMGKTGGGAVYAEASFYYGLTLSFCSCSFAKNIAPDNPKASTLLVENNVPAGVAPHKADVHFCDTPIPAGSVFPAKQNGTVTVDAGRRCFRRYC